jgi:AraC-like DNA-binding protein
MDRKTVLEILYAVGFNNKSAYNIAFKRATGLTPTEFRKKHTN